MQTGYRPDGDHEPFGFHDGIAQPSIAGITGDGVPTGEFILGYPNHFQIIPPTPVVPAELDRDAVLPPLANPYHASQPLRDLGLNGSYVVYRKLQQDVAGFWQFMKREAVRSTGAEDTGHMIWLASRCVGRWPSGAPLVLAPRRRRSRGRRPRRLPVRRRRGWPGLPAWRAHPPYQPARRHQAVRARSIPQHVRVPSSAPSRRGRSDRRCSIRLS